MFILEVRGEVNHEKPRVRGLSFSEDRVIVAGVVLTQCQRVTDKRSDGRTPNGCVSYTVVQRSKMTRHCTDTVQMREESESGINK